MTPTQLSKTPQTRTIRETIRRHALGILGLLCCLGISPVNGADVINAVLLSSGLQEKLEPDVNVSGNIIVGVMFSSAHLGLISNTLAIQPSRTKTDEICLKTTSRDGAYTSENLFRGKGKPQDILYLPYESKYPDVLKNYPGDADSVAITATAGECSQSKTADYYLPGRLDGRNQKLYGQGIRIYINGFDATDVSYQLEGIQNWLPAKDCDYIEEGRHTAYNFTCKVEEVAVNVANPVTVRILREVYGRELEPVTFKILAVNSR